MHFKSIVLGQMKIYLNSTAVIDLFEMMWTAGIQMKWVCNPSNETTSSWMKSCEIKRKTVRNDWPRWIALYILCGGFHKEGKEWRRGGGLIVKWLEVQQCEPCCLSRCCFLGTKILHINLFCGPFEFRKYRTVWTIGSCLACAYRVMEAFGMFGEHESSVRVDRGAAESNSPSSQILVHPQLDIRTLTAWNNCFIS